MPTSLSSRALALSAAIAVAAVALVTLPAVSPSISVASASAATLCAAVPVDPRYGQVRGATVQNPRDTSETEVGVYIGGDFLVRSGAQEAEGIFVVGENATYNPGLLFSQGSVGAGSQVVPADGSDMLTTGGNVAVTSGTLQVGTPNGGRIVAGGTITGAVDNYPGVTHLQNVTAPVALAPYAAVPALYTDLSDAYTLLPTTGTVTTGAVVTFTGDNVSTRQVFSVSGSQLGTLASDVSVVFTGIPDDAIIVVNVTGASPTLSVNSFFLDTLAAGQIGYTDSRFSPLTQSLVWNFAEATGTLTLGNHSQLLGSVIAPDAATTNLLTSTNGRVYVGGDLNFADARGGLYDGMEFHNYPFRDRLCATAATADFTITKTVSDPDAVTLATREYTGTYSCVDALGDDVRSGTWSLPADGVATITGLPVGTECSATEDAATLSAQPAAGNATYSWAAPSYSATSVTVSASSTVGITVNNAVLQGVGTLSITKTLTDADAVVTTGRLFSGTYECRAGTTVVASGTWSVAAGAPAFVVSTIPAPSTCTVAETSLGTAPSATDASYQWEAPTYSPAAAVSVTTAATTGVLVQNVVRRGLGDLEMIKILDDPFDVVNLDRIYTGTWSCTFNGATTESGTWSTTAGAAPVTLATDLPVGSVCVLAEDAATLAAPPLAGFPQYIWREPTISPATVSILDGVVHRFTVTNTVYDPISELAHSGTDSVLPIAIGGGAAGAGILFLMLARRRRVALQRQAT